MNTDIDGTRRGRGSAAHVETEPGSSGMSQWGTSDGQARTITILLWAGAILVALGVAGICAAAYWLWG